mmetsp:Transcript_68764/g.155774  ORF Transcript_68764/g.155774 Transcript_68764/m.155774 type:complete len:214 (+) Transcript_68764:76-717(+)
MPADGRATALERSVKAAAFVRPRGPPRHALEPPRQARIAGRGPDGGDRGASGQVRWQVRRVRQPQGLSLRLDGEGRRKCCCRPETARARARGCRAVPKAGQRVGPALAALQGGCQGGCRAGTGTPRAPQATLHGDPGLRGLCAAEAAARHHRLHVCKRQLESARDHGGRALGQSVLTPFATSSAPQPVQAVCVMRELFPQTMFFPADDKTRQR